MAERQKACIGQRIKNLLKASNVTQKELAESVGISEAKLSLYVNDKNEPSLVTATKIADTLGVSLDYLVNGRVEPVEKLIESKTGLSTESVRILKRWEKYSADNDLVNPINLLIEQKQFQSAIDELFTASKMLIYDYNGKVPEGIRKLIHELNKINTLQTDNIDDYKLVKVELARLHVEDAKKCINDALDIIRTKEGFINGKC